VPSATDRSRWFFERSQASPVMSSMVLGLPPAPAVLNRMSRPPKVSTAACIVALMFSSLVTSQWTNFTWPLKRRSSSWPFSTCTSAAMTFAPSETNNSTVPRPKPAAAPVMTAILSFKRSKEPSRCGRCPALTSCQSRQGGWQNNPLFRKPVTSDFADFPARNGWGSAREHAHQHGLGVERGGVEGEHVGDREGQVRGGVQRGVQHLRRDVGIDRADGTFGDAVGDHGGEAFRHAVGALDHGDAQLFGQGGQRGGTQKRTAFGELELNQRRGGRRDFLPV